MRLDFSLGRNKNDNTPKPSSCSSFPEFQDFILGARHALPKDEAPYFARAFGPNNGIAARRAVECALPCAWIGLDIDQLDPGTVDALNDALAPLEGFWYATATATPQNCKRRIILALDRIATIEEHPRAVDAISSYLVARLGAEHLRIDLPVSRDVARLWYLPGESAPAGAFHGHPIDLERALASLPPPEPTATAADPTPDDDLRAAVLAGVEGHVYHALVSLSARLIGRGMVQADALSVLHALLESCTWRDKNPTVWRERFDACAALVATAAKRFADPRRETKQEIPPADEPLEYVRTYCDFERWAESAPPQREWAIDNWIGMGHVTLLAARGGMGKSIFVQQAGTALAIGREFIAHVSHPRTCLAWMGEDDDDELWRRQVAICSKFVTPIDGLRGRLMLESMIETDCTLVANIHGAGLVRTAMLRELRDQIGDLKAEVVVLDNIARVFAGNENDRHDVTSFIAALSWAANPTSAAVILVGHTAKAAESEFAGNAAWENACRMRMWMTDKPPDKKDDDKDDPDGQPDTDLRYVSKRKVNYTSRDLCILRYTAGAYDIVEMPTNSPLVAHIQAEKARRIIIAALPRLETMGMFPTTSTSSPYFLPKLLIQHQLNDGLPRFELLRAMRDLMLEGIVVNAVVGQYQNRTPRYGLKLK